MVARQRDAQFGHRRDAIAQQAVPEGCINPGLGHHPSTVLRQPLFFNQAALLGDELGGGQALGLQRRLDGGGALFNRRGDNVWRVGFGHAIRLRRLESPQYRSGPAAPEPTARCATRCATPRFAA